MTYRGESVGHCCFPDDVVVEMVLAIRLDRSATEVVEYEAQGVIWQGDQGGLRGDAAGLALKGGPEVEKGIRLVAFHVVIFVRKAPEESREEGGGAGEDPGPRLEENVFM